jgi:hypothetical protein
MKIAHFLPAHRVTLAASLRKKLLHDLAYGMYPKKL